MKRFLVLFVTLALASLAVADTIPVLYPEGVVHGFLTLSTRDGKRVADGDSIQVAKGDRVTSKVVFRFADGSLHEETTVFMQKGRFGLASYRLVQKGPSFPHPIDFSVDRASGRCVVKVVEKDGEKTYDERLELPPDLANGMVPILLKNVRPDAARLELPMVLATPRPRLVKLVIGPDGEDAFRIAGGAAQKATRYRVRIDLKGVVGVVAEVVGKAPEDTLVWIEHGEAPAFVKSEGPMAMDAPQWRIELASPEFGGK
jgi:hypothetical protein